MAWVVITQEWDPRLGLHNYRAVLPEVELSSLKLVLEPEREMCRA